MALRNSPRDVDAVATRAAPDLQNARVRRKPESGNHAFANVVFLLSERLERQMKKAVVVVDASVVERTRSLVGVRERRRERQVCDPGANRIAIPLRRSQDALIYLDGVIARIFQLQRRT